VRVGIFTELLPLQVGAWQKQEDSLGSARGPHPDSNDVVQHLLEGEQPGLDDDGDNTHDVEGSPPDGNKATEEEHPSPQLEVHHSLYNSVCHV